jgi:hypothetical protein
MGERKVLNKYIPADFDPKLVPRGKKPKDDLVTVRMMLPFTIQCTTCSTFLYRGRKFNSKKESMKGIDGKYLGIQRFRFYIKCSDCSRPITFLTDPKNTDYEMESGGTRNYEVWHDERRTNEEMEKKLEEEEKLDSMRALENRVLESQREMAELDDLEEIQAMNKRHVSLMKGGNNRSRMDVAETVLRARERALGINNTTDEDELNEHGLTKDEEDLVSSIKFGITGGGREQQQQHLATEDATSSSNSSSMIRRLNEEDELIAEQMRINEAEALIVKQQQNSTNSERKRSSMPVVFKVKKRKLIPPPSITEKADASATVSGINDSGGVLGGLLGAYGSDSD